MGDKESKTGFTYVQAFGNKNIARIFAGGNHSWIVIDDVIPIRDNHRIPSPLGRAPKESEVVHNRSSSNTPLRIS